VARLVAQIAAPHDIASTEGEQLSQPEAPGPGEQDEDPVAVLDGLGEVEHDLGIDERPLSSPLDASARILQGLSASRSSSTAVVRIVRSSR